MQSEPRKPSPPTRTRRGGAFRRLALFAFPLIVGLVGAWLGLTVLGHETVSMGPFVVRLDAGFGRGVTDIALPPLGHIEADSHLAPLRLRATLEDMGLPRLAKEFGHRTVSEIVDDVQDDAARDIRPFAFRVFLVSVVGAVALAVLTFRTTWRPIPIAVL